MTFQVKLETFEGPLDLLLHIIKKNNMDIYDISIAQITSAYLEYINLVRSFNIDLASEFLVMAATLINIKSKMLLPSPELSGEEEEDPRSELIERLLEYKKIKEAALALKDKETQQKDIFTRGKPTFTEEDYQIDTSLFDLLDAFEQVLKKAPGEIKEITGEEITIEEKIRFITNALEKNEFIKFKELVSSSNSKIEIIVTLLALLELIRVRCIVVRQSKMFGDIRLYRGKQFDQKEQITFTQEEVN